MSQHDYNLANDTGANFRADANNALGAIQTLNSGASAPSTTAAYMLWADTTNGLLKQRNAANTAWITIGTLALDGLGINASDYRAVGINCTNNTTTPNTQFDLDADVITLRDANNNSIIRFNPGAAITNNVSTAGPAANGRDQSGAFSASSWVHFYWIWNGSTLATLSSTVAPPTGPTLPSGYTHWAYAGAVRFNASSQLVRSWITGAWVYMDAPISFTSLTSTSETSVSISSAVPPNALALQAYIDTIITTDGSGAVSATMYLRLRSGGANYYPLVIGTASGFTASTSMRFFAAPMVLFPNVAQTLYYDWDITLGSAQSGSINVMSYQVPNGGE